ncbi:MAG: 2-oxoacid ferredoxin oxidoreductase [Sulfurimonas sp. RIFCSPLOWO2_12_FULL_34_6]|nr:MAG: 2-oxoacid ferredoxin oxidoreductase [Sulfurimonas sp. RIFCSPLOWO2_12_FULL_34_6]
MRHDTDNAWCPGCGNFGILNILTEVLQELEVKKQDIVFVSGIGQAAKTPHYLDVNMFNGLHGRALPVATGIKMANPELIVVAEGGDGDMYGEGGNHFLSAVRRNVNIVHIVHNNMVYGLTKGQASPTSQREFKTKVQVNGVSNEPFNPILTALSLNASFVARAYMQNKEHTKGILKAAFLHKGYALIDIFQPCVTFNSLNTYEWFSQNSYMMDENEHDILDISSAMDRARETHPFALGIFYKQERKTFEEYLWSDKKSPKSLHVKKHDIKEIQKQFDRYTIY